MLTRRQTLLGASTLPVLPLFAQVSDVVGDVANLSSDVRDALNQSLLIYLTPLKLDGSESACKAEVWFFYDNESHIYVVTQYDAWRTNAIRQQLNTARSWVGEFGVWTRADNAFREAPELMLKGEIVSDIDVQNGILDRMGGKYTREWGVWGPRFRAGLRDDSRAMLRYRIT